MSTKSNAPAALKLALQVNLAILSLVSLWYAAAGLMLGAAPYFEGEPPPGLDNQARYVAGVYLLFPFLIWWIIPSIERHAIPIRILAAAMMCGGIGRLVSFMQFGSDDDMQLILMVVEISAPMLIVWQRLVALLQTPPETTLTTSRAE